MDMYYINKIIEMKKEAFKHLNRDAKLDTVMVSRIVSDVMGDEFHIHAAILKEHGLNLIRNLDNPGCSISIFDSSKTRVV